MNRAEMENRFGSRNLEVVQATIEVVRAYLTESEWGGKMIHRSGWLVKYDRGERVYVHVTGWKVKDFCGPNEGIAVQTVGPDAGKELRNPGGRLFFSAFQAMLYVEKFLRGEPPPAEVL